MSEHNIGDEPIEKRYREQMHELAHFLDEELNGDLKGHDRKIGFVLMMFEFGDTPGRCNYVSNGNREDVVTMLREQLRRFQGAPDVTGHA